MSLCSGAHGGFCMGQTVYRALETQSQQTVTVLILEEPRGKQVCCTVVHSSRQQKLTQRIDSDARCEV